MYYDGIPSTPDYLGAIESDSFKEMEQWSRSFLSTNEVALKSYSKKWVSDPLHHWSRQWEYPYVYSKVDQAIQNKPNAKILDAGSGISFFPFYLNYKFEDSIIHCSDYDKLLESIYEKINNQLNKPIDFSTADLRSLPYEDNTFDLVYCISVLEHTSNYEEIIDQFHKILVPGGSLIITFDISLDGLRDISIDKATTLYAYLLNKFKHDSDHVINLGSDVMSSDIFTSLMANDINPELLPWNAPPILYQMKSFMTKGKFGSWPPSLTVCCINLKKHFA